MANSFTLFFTGDQEVPPVHTEAGGTGTVSWDGAALTAAYEFTVSGVDFGPVLGMDAQTETTADDVTIMHVHNAPGASPARSSSGRSAPRRTRTTSASC